MLNFDSTSFQRFKGKSQINLYYLANSRRQEERINNLRCVLRSKQDHLLMISSQLLYFLLDFSSFCL
ncbi:MAG: hypothetical protein ACRD80_06770, partial [Nitrososphaeraceae archaeon]